ncbi:prolyl oligopeptidase family serine peptidase [Lentibacillus halophilus]|uniref:Prolyl oligopeptidase family serine peptidase n=1 Tax=Lentibacillus halophilus TaxID=295065 RepID=A0ABN0Z4V1_9BACI
MIGIDNIMLASIPSLMVADQAYEQEALPVLTYFHGFTSAKEHNLPLAYYLAQKGYRVVLPDSLYHGERETDASVMEKQLSFWDIVMQNVHELKAIKQALADQGLIMNGRFGVAGTSMGGITTTAALRHYSWIQTAAILMGSPKMTDYARILVDQLKKDGDLSVTDESIAQLYEQLQSYDLSEQVSALNERPVLFWHGDSDPVIPFDHSHTFYEHARYYYTNTEHIQLLKEPNRGHKVSRYAILETVKWFEKYL